MRKTKLEYTNKESTRDKDLISIVIPVYNSSKYLRKCLNSVLKQAYKRIEVICINNKSSDNSCEILKMYKAKDKRIRIINNSVNNIAKARNIGIDKAKGKYIIFIDSDDYIDKEAIYVLHKEIKHHNADVCFCGIESFEKGEKNNKKIGINLKNVKVQPFNMYSIENNDILTITNPGSVNKLYKLSFIKKHKIRFPNKKRAEDLYFTYLSLILANSIVGIEKYNYHYRIHEESITHSFAYNPLEFCSVFIMLKRKIIKLNYQNILKNSFNLAFDIICKNELERLNNNMSKEEYSLMIKELNVNIKAGVYL